MTYVITGGCVDIMDRECIGHCPVDAIVPGTRMVYINPDDCIDCGACVLACPQNAIFAERQVPVDQSHFTGINAEFFDFDDTGDHPNVAALTPRR